MSSFTDCVLLLLMVLMMMMVIVVMVGVDVVDTGVPAENDEVFGHRVAVTAREITSCEGHPRQGISSSPPIIVLSGPQSL